MNTPEGWAAATLGQIVEPRSGKASPAFSPQARFVGMEHIEPHTMRLLATVPASSMKSAANAFEATDVLYGRLRAYLNKVYQPDFRGLCSGEFIVIPQSAAVLGRFLKYRLNAADFVRFASHLNTGDRPRVDFDQLRAFQFILPPHEEQNRIADALDELLSDLDAGVAALERAKAKLARYRASILKAAVEGALTTDWRDKHPHVEPANDLLARILVERRQRWEKGQHRKFKEAGKAPPKNWKAKYKEPLAPDTSQFASLPEGWCWVSFDQVGDIQGGLQKTPERAPRKNYHPYLRVANVQRGSLDLAELHDFELTAEELDRLRLEPGDLLIVEGNGSRTEIGRCAIWRGEVDNCIHQNHLIRVRPLTGVNPRYIDLFLNSPSGQNAIQLVASSTSGLYTLSVSKIRRLSVPLPPPEEQDVVVEGADDQLSVIDHVEADIEARLAGARALRQAILRHGFTGKLVRQDPNDEPASELLKRISAERSARASEEGSSRLKTKPNSKQRNSREQQAALESNI